MGGLATTASRARRAYRMRRWSVRNARLMELVYDLTAPVLKLLAPLWRQIGPKRVEKPLLAIEDSIKSFLFGCQTCGQCVLSETGMSCPMNCPKSLRNGPCGGVRGDGMCELDAQMPCVWVQGWQGSHQMKGGAAFFERLRPLDHRRIGHSSWLDIGTRGAEIVDDTRRPDGGR